MKIERNAKSNDRKAVVKHIQHRAHAVGKKRSHVRIRGHKINQDKLFRWAKENLMDKPSACPTPPSRGSFYKAFHIILTIIALPSYISIYTNSVCETQEQASPVMFGHQSLVNGFTTASDTTSTLVQRLLQYAQRSNYTIEAQDAHALFNDLQTILGSEYTAGKRENDDQWNPSMNEDIVQIRNLMNVTEAILMSGELKGM